MRALRSFTVRAQLPEALAPLERLASNLRWSWDERTRSVFRWVDPASWDDTNHDPMAVLSRTQHDRWEALANDSGFVRFLREVDGELSRALGDDGWFQLRGESPLHSIAYFSPEFGISEAVPQYSGGLGVLAGDHLKAASDLGVPIVGIGLFYQHGYFRQSLSHDGWQQERFPDLDPHAMALQRCPGVRIALDLNGIEVHAQIWRASVGRTALYLLDTDVDENTPEVRTVTDRLYGGDIEHRLRQEILLGMGGVRALDALGVEAQVFHTNEGHAGFLGLERIRKLVTEQGLTFPEAAEAVRAGSIFTTHTPVPAGIDQFPRELMARYFTRLADECGVGFDTIMALGQRSPDDDRFNMAVMGLRLAARSNGVSQLHGRVSRAMFRDLWPDADEHEVPIGAITNGVHGPTWVGDEMAELFTRHVSPIWAEAGPDAWARIDDVRDEDLWRARSEGRDHVVTAVRERVRRSAMARGLARSAVEWVDSALDPAILTIGFARRFATYKRATLLLSQPDRLRALLLDPARPVQFLFAGKAHPADDLGKDMIRRIVHFSSDPAVRHRFVFVDDYDISLARALYQGCDVWLNNPRRPLEACGTSGMKAALNGALNCSVLDGWWDEWFDGENGWAISSNEGEEDQGRRDEFEANSLFELLEHEIVPLFYDRQGNGNPRGWTARIRASLRSLGPKVLASRMVRDYTTELYEPTAARATAMVADGHRRARELAAWKARVRRSWAGVHIVGVDVDTSVGDLGGTRVVSAEVALGDLAPADVRVEIVHGPLGQSEEIAPGTVTPMAVFADGVGGHRHYRGQIDLLASGHYGLTVRVVPDHADLVTPIEVGHVTWAS